jgi:hypothetical protein
MTIQVTSINVATTASANSFVAFGVQGAGTEDIFLTVDVISSSLDSQGRPGGMIELYGVFTTTSPATLAIIKSSTVNTLAFYNFSTYSEFDQLLTVSNIRAIGSTPGTNLEIRNPPNRFPWIEIPTLPADVLGGLGIVVSVLPVQSSSFTMFPDILITYNFTKTPPVTTEGLENRQNIKIVDDQKSGAEAGSSKEYTLELTRLEQEDLTIDNTQANLRKRTAATILAGNKSKDRRNIINSIVNNYSKATKRS